MANIREHCSWVHAKQKERPPKRPRTSSACRWPGPAFLEPLQEFDLPVNKAALVVGGGIAGMTCALSIARQGHEVHLVEKEKDLGGMARRIHTTLEGMDVQEYLDGLIRAVYKNPRIHVSHEAVITRCVGLPGQLHHHG
jgi:heterodisulfide reductase subunit A